MEKQEVYVEIGKLSAEEQIEKVYETMKELKEQLGRGASHREIFDRCNEKHGPNIRFSETQITQNLRNLKYKEEKIKSEYKEIDGKEYLLFFPVEE